MENEILKKEFSSEGKLEELEVFSNFFSSRRIKSHWITPFSQHIHSNPFIYIYTFPFFFSREMNIFAHEHSRTNANNKRNKKREEKEEKWSSQRFLPPPVILSSSVGNRCEACREISLRSRKNTRHDRADRVIVTLPLLSSSS